MNRNYTKEWISEYLKFVRSVRAWTTKAKKKKIESEQLEQNQLIHWSMVGDDESGVCWDGDHQPDPPQRVATNIGLVTCKVCLQFYRILDDLKKERGQ